MHQLDFVTPRYITGYGKIVSINRIDVYSNQANLDQYVSKGTDSVINFLIDDWQEFGVPEYIQLDNEASFRGSLIHHRTFGNVTRFCLNFGVQLVFIPFKEPWRNAYIESFNGRFNSMVWQFQKYRDLEHLKRESRKFRDKNNNYQEYKKRTFSKQISHNCSKRFLPKNFIFDVSKSLPITKGRMHFIRLVDEKGYVTILNEPVYVSKDVSFEYVWSIIDTEQKTLNTYYQATKESPKELLKTKSYELREPVCERIPITDFC